MSPNTIELTVQIAEIIQVAQKISHEAIEAWTDTSKAHPGPVSAAACGIAQTVTQAAAAAAAERILRLAWSHKPAPAPEGD